MDDILEAINKLIKPIMGMKLFKIVNLAYDDYAKKTVTKWASCENTLVIIYFVLNIFKISVKIIPSIAYAIIVILASCTLRMLVGVYSCVQPNKVKRYIGCYTLCFMMLVAMIVQGIRLLESYSDILSRAGLATIELAILVMMIKDFEVAVDSIGKFKSIEDIKTKEDTEPSGEDNEPGADIELSEKDIKICRRATKVIAVAAVWVIMIASY